MASRRVGSLLINAGISRAHSNIKPRLLSPSTLSRKTGSQIKMSTIAAFKVPKILNEPNVRLPFPLDVLSLASDGGADGDM